MNDVVHGHCDAQFENVADELAEEIANGDRRRVGAVGSSYDNALAESINGLYKTELIRPRRPWRTIEEVELATAE
jgi:putative transposase